MRPLQPALGDPVVLSGCFVVVVAYPATIVLVALGLLGWPEFYFATAATVSTLAVVGRYKIKMLHGYKPRQK